MATMPFGKYSGVPLSAVPDEYIEWLCSIELRQPLLGAVLNEVEARGLEIGHQGHHPATTGPELDRDMVKAVYRQLAIEYHPDKQGGNGDIMKGINIFRDRLKEEGV